jgi:hypothetical protein
VRFRELIDRNAHDYIKVTSKYEKTQVIVAVIETLRCESPGGFVKKHFYSGRWYKIGDEKARDKVGHAIRKAAEELERKAHSRTPKGQANNALKKAKKDFSSGGASGAAANSAQSPADNKQQADRQSTQPAPLNSPLPTLSSLYGEDDRRIAHSLATRQHQPDQQMVADRQILPSFAGPAARCEAPQAYMSNHLLERRSLPPSSNQVSTHSNLLRGGETNPSMAPAFSGLTQSSLHSPKGKAENALKKVRTDVSSGGAKEAPSSAQSPADSKQQAGPQSNQPAPLNSPLPTLGSLHEGDERRVAHWWATRLHLPDHMLAGWQIIPSFARPAAGYEAPQAYTSNNLLGRSSLPAWSNQMSTQSNLLLAGGERNPGMAPALSGLTRSSLHSVGHSTTPDATSAYQLAALRELGMQQRTSAYSRLNPETMLSLTSAVTLSQGGLGQPFMPQSQLGMLLGISNLPSADTPSAGRIQPTGVSWTANECLSSGAADKARGSQSDSD